MSNSTFLATCLIVAAGGVASAGPAHLFVNAATGEVIATTGAAPRGAALEPVWTLGAQPCNGQVSMIVADDPADPDRFGLIHMDWGDVASDTTVSVAQIGIATGYDDEDADGDGLADGVPGLGVRLAFYSGENGGGSSTEVGSVTLMDLPGNTSGMVEPYVLTVDLSGVGSPDGVPLGSTDTDGDGLADFGYSLEYIHPLTDQHPPRAAYLLLGAPEGQAVPDGQGGWTIVPDPAPNAQGATDAIDVYRRDTMGDPQFVETITGGFACGDEPGGFYAQIGLSLFTRPAANACPADLFPAPKGDGQLNFFDVSSFIALFNAQDPAADFFPAGGDGQFNFFDVSAFMSAFNAGCP